MSKETNFQIHIVISEDNTFIVHREVNGFSSPNFSDFGEAREFTEEIKINPKILNKDMCEHTIMFLEKATYNIVKYITVRTCEIIDTI